MMHVHVACLLSICSATVSPPYATQDGAECYGSDECGVNQLCLIVRDRRLCTTVVAVKGTPSSLPAECFSTAWPDVKNCVKWTIADDVRICESNDVPPYHVPPYCPFGIGQGYCNAPALGNSTDCPPFRGKVCPCVPCVANATHSCPNPGPDEQPPPGPGPGPGPSANCPANTTKAGDILVAVNQIFKFPLHPNPLDEEKPIHMYAKTALTNGNTYQVIGAHLNGVQLKGPAEANGFNVDLTLIPLPCGGHVTPPVGPGPVYHYHKAADCLTIESPGTHGPLIGYANDGFGIYGFGDYLGAPLLDQCHGHFGPVPDLHLEVKYHYHASPEYNMPGEPHRPYYMGCQGPSKGKCNSTVSKDYDSGANWCGQGCGFDICVQPGTNASALTAYLDSNCYATKGKGCGAEWLGQFTVNSFERRLRGEAP